MQGTTDQGDSVSGEGGVSSPTATGSEQPIGDGESDELELDIVFDALRNTRRRRLLRYINEQNGQVTLGELAEHLAAVENDTTPEAVDGQQRKRAYVALYQSHLPKLDSMGVLSFNSQRGLIERKPAASQLDKYLYDEETETRPWKRYYVECIGVSAVVLLLGGATGIIGRIGAVSLFIGISIGVLVPAAYHAYEHG